MSVSRDDTIIAIRSAFLKKNNQQKFSLLTLIVISIIILVLNSFNFKIMVGSPTRFTLDPLISYCKFFIYGNSKERMPDHVKIFNKVGLAYGFLLDNAYIVDLENKIEFFLSAVVYSNSNGVLNDDSYDYDTLTIPFLADIGRAIYEYELERNREFDPDLSHLDRIES